jgi:hypothetical protein
MSAMKKSSVFVAVILGCFVGSAHAQGNMTVTVPFPFIVGHQEFPAGQYDVRTPDGAQEVIEIEGVNNKAAAFALTLPAGGGDPIGNQPALVFSRHENEYRLSQIWESSTIGHELPALSSARPATERSEAQPGSSETPAYVLEAKRK